MTTNLHYLIAGMAVLLVVSVALTFSSAADDRGTASCSAAC